MGAPITIVEIINSDSKIKNLENEIRQLEKIIENKNFEIEFYKKRIMNFKGILAENKVKEGLV